MQCVSCKGVELRTERLEDKLVTHRCNSCHGHFIGLGDYQHWLEYKGDVLPEKAPSGTAPEPVTQQRIKVCPQCGHLMMKYKLGRGTEITLDHCHNCGGVWFDENEWAVLKDRNLHDEVYKIFTAPWQSQVREEVSRQNFATLYTEAFGEADYAEIQRVRAWLAEHPKADELLAYLQDADPYRA